MKYRILTEPTPPELMASVEGFLKDGWLPLGGVAVTTDRDRWTNERKGYSESSIDVTWAQAMVKDGE